MRYHVTVRNISLFVGQNIISDPDSIRQLVVDTPTMKIKCLSCSLDMLPDHVQHIDCLRKITNISILNIIKTLDNVGLLFKKQL